MRIVFAGTPEVALPALQGLAQSHHDLIAVITRPDAPAGRGRRLSPSPVAHHAAELGVEVLKPEHPRDQEFQRRLRELAPDCCPVVAYGALVPQRALEIPRHGWVNLHFSLLPAWRGAAPVQRAIMAGDGETGATTFRLVTGLDEGPTYSSIRRPISSSDTAGSLLAALAHDGAGLLLRTLDGIASGQLPEVAQPTQGVSLAPKVSVDEARVCFDRPAIEIDRLIRGCTPAPGAWAVFRGERFKMAPVRAVEADELSPGELRVEKRRVLVGTGQGVLELGLVKAFGKKEMAATDWARGSRIDPGERLE